MLDGTAMDLIEQAKGLKIGYARVSTDVQNLAPQLDALAGEGCAQIYEEHASGSDDNRPELSACLKALRPGDTLVVWRLDRLGRNIRHIIATVEDLASRGIGFQSMTDNVSGSGASARLTLNIFAAFADHERHVISERTRAGLAAARARGRKGGRPKALTDKQLREAKLLLTDPEASVTELAKSYGVSRATLYSGLKRLEDGGGRVPVERR